MKVVFLANILNTYFFEYFFKCTIVTSLH
jgi:hypothetical protein